MTSLTAGQLPRIPGLQYADHVAFTVPDLDEAVGFFVEALGAEELYRSTRKRAFISELQRYVPELSVADAVPAPAGVRAQAVDRDGSLVDDFRLGVTDHVVWVRNAPSPAATSSLAIAEELVGRLVS